MSFDWIVGGYFCSLHMYAITCTCTYCGALMGKGGHISV